MNNCQNCGSGKCSGEICLQVYHPLSEGCGSEHIAMNPAPDQCIPLGAFIKCNSNNLAEVWQPGDTEPVIGVAYKQYNVDEYSTVDCNIHIINVWVCGYFEVPPEMMTCFDALTCSASGSNIRKICPNRFIL